MRTMGWIAMFVFAAVSARAETLADQLKASGIPENSFTKAELAQTINGSAAQKDKSAYVVYLHVENNVLKGPPRLIRYDQNSGKVFRTEVEVDKDDLNCCGSPEEIEFTGDYFLLQFHNMPSSSTILVLNEHLKTVAALYGFGAREIAPGEIVYVEGMVHFASVHPERLAYVNLRNRTAGELYPPKGDKIRAEYTERHKKVLPAPDVCARLNDSCEPGDFDEEIRFLGSDGSGRFAVATTLRAAHVDGEGNTVAEVPAQSALYVYEREADGWRYCQQALNGPVDRVLRHNDYGEVAGRCTPKMPVVPGGAGADYDPFPLPFRQVN